VAQNAIQAGCIALAVATVDEALMLRESGIQKPVMIFGERTASEFEVCLKNNFICFVNDIATIEAYNKLAAMHHSRAVVHLEIDSGLSRYGVRWSESQPVIRALTGQKNLKLAGIMSHFAMSDELDKTFANEQLRRFRQVLDWMSSENIRVEYRHMCNSGGFLDLPAAYFDMVRIGILPLGVYPSQVCRRIPGIGPVMSVKTRISSIRDLQPGDKVGYGMRYEASESRRIAVLPVGYGDGYPRVRNSGDVLIRGKRARIIGGNAMDATMIDITEIPQARRWDEVTLMGKQGEEEIDAHEIAALKGTVSYEVLSGWRGRLPRIYKD
jgi:alanine racemase